MLKFIWVQSNRIPYSGDLFMFGPGFIHFTQPSYVQKSAETYLANLTNLALMPNFPFRILHPRKGFMRMPHATMGPQTNVASMEFKFSAQHCTVIPLSLQFHSLKSPGHLLHMVPTMVICGPKRSGHWRLDVVRRPQSTQSTQSMRSTTGALWASAASAASAFSWHWELP